MPVTTSLDEELLSNSLNLADGMVTALAVDAAVAPAAAAALDSATGADVVLDESSGLQNGALPLTAPAEDRNDNDILLSLLPSEFSTRLAALPGTTIAIGAALSGYNGSNNGLDAFTINAGTATVTDVKFVDVDGNALDGDDSGITTVSGQSILLYTDSTNNNILLGRVGGAGGDIAFAAYIEQTPTGGKIWMVQYDALFNPDTGNPDDAIDLTDKVFIGIDQDTSFSLAGAPSGQNLFLMFTTATPSTFVDGLGVTRISDVSIIATGKTPVIGANGQFTNTSDTVNTSQAGGPTTFGTNSQMITEQEGIRFTYVIGARQNVTIPNLDQNEADVEANIDYTEFFGARSGQFDVVQLQSGKSAQVKVTTINNVGDGAGALFVDGYADDGAETIALSRMQVLDTATGAVLADSTGSPSANGLVITLATGLITGVKAGQTIVYTTATDHNRVLVENGAATNASGNTHADFDIGGFKLLQQTTAITEVGSKMIFEDDGPSTSLTGSNNPGETSVDESNLPGGATSTFNFSDFFVPGTPSGGTDGVGTTVPGPITIALVNPAGTESGLVDTLSGDKIYLYQSGDSIVGRVGLDDNGGANPLGAIAFTITIDTTTGAGSLTQSRSVVHGITTDANDTVTMGANLFTVTRVDKVTDAEGDEFFTPPEVVTVGAFFNFDDDGPTVTLSAATTPTLPTDDTDIPDTAGPTSFASLFTSSFGQDGFKDSDDNDVEDTDALGFTLGVSAPNAASGLIDTLSADAIVLSLEGGVVFGRVGAGGLEAFRIGVDADTGAVTLVQSRSVVHNDPADAVESGASAAGMAAALVTLTAKVIDGDGDSAIATKNIGDAFKFEDDGPSIDPNAVAVPTLTTDDTEIPDSAGPTSFAGLFTGGNFGKDGFKDSDDNDIEDADAISYSLGVSGPNAASGLTDTLTNDAVLLNKVGNDIVGTVGALEVLRISVNADTGAVTLVQSRSVVHNDPADAVESGASAAGIIAAAVTLTATITDGDGDTDTALRNIGDAFKFEDDGPSISVNATATPTLVTDDTDVPDTAGPTSFASLFTSSFGQDGFKDGDDNDVEDADALGFSLGVSAPNAASGLVDTLSADAIVLSLESGVVYGRVGAGGLEAFRISVDADTGAVTLVQSRSVVHNDPGDAVESGSSAAGMAAALVTLTAKVIDGDGDSASATKNIGDAFKFEDDGPSISVDATATPTLVTDDTDIPDTAGPTSFASLFTPLFGKDGFKDTNDDDAPDADAVTYALGVSAPNASSGLVDSLTNTGIVLSLEGAVVYGRVGAGGAEAFRISVNASGGVTLVQSRAVMHNDPLDPVESGASAAGLSAANLVTLTATVTDGDGDQASAVKNIGDAFKFEDDGPSVSFGNIVGSGTIVPQQGFWSGAGGNDGVANLDILLNGFQLVRPNGTTVNGTSFTFNESASSPDGSGTYHWTGSLTGDFDNNSGSADQTVNFALDVFANGTYKLDLVQGFGSSTTISSANGALDAGGPDPVRTLTIGTESIVFFAANPVAPTGSPPTPAADTILAGVGVGAPDPTEAQLQTTPLPSFIGNFSMNVSTAGIGVKNNVFQGDTSAAITVADESFVINPQTLMSKVKVFIDNSVAGYNPATEDLYYRAYYQDGTVSALTEVNAGALTAEAGGQVSFVIEKNGALLIDAVQLVMGRGEIKIPVIEFTSETNTLGSDVKLGFTATLTDKDGDSAASSFLANLFANELNAAFDYQLSGNANKGDAFNIDLASSDESWQVQSFVRGEGDKIVVLGGGTLGAITSGGGNSSFTITETAGGQVTTVTVVGVADLNNADIVFGS